MSNFLCPPSLDAVDVERQNPRRGDTKQEKKIPKVTASGRMKRKDSTSLAVTWEDQMGPIFVRVTDSSNSKAKKTSTTRRKKPHSSSSTAKKQTDDRRWLTVFRITPESCRYTDADPLLVTASLAKMNLDPQQ